MAVLNVQMNKGTLRSVTYLSFPYFFMYSLRFAENNIYEKMFY